MTNQQNNKPFDCSKCNISSACEENNSGCDIFYEILRQHCRSVKLKNITANAIAFGYDKANNAHFGLYEVEFISLNSRKPQHTFALCRYCIEHGSKPRYSNLTISGSFIDDMLTAFIPMFSEIAQNKGWKYAKPESIDLANIKCTGFSITKTIKQ